MAPDTRFLVMSGMALLCAASFPVAGEASDNALERLRETGEVSCEPSLPYFCRNLHVSCSGRTSLPTFPFRLRATLTQGSIESAAGTERVRAPYASARIEWDGGGGYVILRPARAKGYLKLLADGTYSLRHYARELGLMSIGRCR